MSYTYKKDFNEVIYEIYDFNEDTNLLTGYVHNEGKYDVQINRNNVCYEKNDVFIKYDDRKIRMIPYRYLAINARIVALAFFVFIISMSFMFSGSKGNGSFVTFKVTNLCTENHNIIGHHNYNGTNIFSHKCSLATGFFTRTSNKRECMKYYGKTYKVDSEHKIYYNYYDVERCKSIEYANNISSIGDFFFKLLLVIIGVHCMCYKIISRLDDDEIKRIKKIYDNVATQPLLNLNIT